MMAMTPSIAHRRALACPSLSLPTIAAIAALTSPTFSTVGRSSYGAAVVDAATLPCSTTQDLRNALSAVQAGDEIVLSAGAYFADSVGLSGTGAHFASYAQGSPSARITLRSSDPANPAVLMGSNPSSLTVLRIYGSYWTVSDIAITGAQKGIVFAGAHHGVIRSCEVYGVGYEGIHILDGSDNCLIEGCHVHDTGISSPGYGEALYIGTDSGSWSRYDPYVTNTTVRGNTLGPNVAAECIDIKEGTYETVVEHNYFDATGLSSANYADSFIDLKGVRSYVRYNTFVRNGEPSLNKAIAVIDRGVELSSYEHAIHDNYFYLDDDPTIRLVDSYSGSYDVYAWSNIREPNESGATGIDDYASLVTASCCPPWYVPPDDGTFCAAPFNLAYANITNTSAFLSWTGYASASSFEVRHKTIDGSSTTSWTDASVAVTTASSLVVTGLDPLTVYAWRVVASCNSTSGSLSAPAAGPDFITLGNGGGNDSTVPPAGAVQVYTDSLLAFWNDYSYGGTYYLDSMLQIKVGSRSIRCEYGSYGGLNLKSSPSLSASGLYALRFWARGDAANDNGAGGDIVLRLRMNSAAEIDLTVSNSAWQIYQIPLVDLGAPSYVESIVLQSRQGYNVVAHVDQIEFVADTSRPTASPMAVPTPSDATSHPTSPPVAATTGSPSSTPITGSPVVVPTATTLVPLTDSPATASPSSSPQAATLSPVAAPVTTTTAATTTTTTASTTTMATTTPGGGSSYIIYGDSLHPDWDNYSYKGTFDFAHANILPDGSTYCIRADFTGYGGLNLKTAFPGVDVSSSGPSQSSLTALRFWVSGGCGHDLRVRVNGKMVDVPTMVSAWEQKTMLLAAFENPGAVYQVEIQHRGGNADTFYFDRIELIP